MKIDLNLFLILIQDPKIRKEWMLNVLDTQI
jgi:hypothetical protein